MSDGNETRRVLNELLNYDYENQDIPGKEHFEALRAASPFTDKLKERAEELGFSGNTSDTKALRDYLFQLLKEEPGVVSKENKKKWEDNLRNWFTPKKGSPSPVMPSDREDVYRLCFALKMHGDKAAEFFAKGYLEQPYNFKDLKETVHFYCLNNNLHYEDSIALYKKAKALPIENGASAETDTLTIGHTICDFHDEESFLDYIRQNRQSFEMHSTRIDQEISRLKKDCMELAQEEKPNPSLLQEESIEIINLEKLISKIYDWDNLRLTSQPVDEYDVKNAPVLIHSSLITNHMQPREIEEGKKSRSLKKKKRGLLVLLTFYHYFAARRVNNRETEEGSFKEFLNLANETLQRCGYGMLYVRNPYDWMFLYCAKHKEPLDAFRDLICEFYFNKDFFVAKVLEIKEETMLVKVINKRNCGLPESAQVSISVEKILEVFNNDPSFVTDNYVRIEFDGDTNKKSDLWRIGEIYRIDVTDIDGIVIEQSVKKS